MMVQKSIHPIKNAITRVVGLIQFQRQVDTSILYRAHARATVCIPGSLAATIVIFHGETRTRTRWNSRPSSTEERYDEYGDREYRAAERLGEQMSTENCHALYPECRRSVLDVFSTVIT
ncbi:hypothetical protein E2986_06889 [Frieseomelitta varia]|uniref:Uncharacterized protein n=1 Tax=Frieseomelitta varia TaxID=561572 RepID=A0A833WEM1_9HYME|nr:hypothetical protein E2986_06889 [Frieseomelitta varia]